MREQTGGPAGPGYAFDTSTAADPATSWPDEEDKPLVPGKELVLDIDGRRHRLPIQVRKSSSSDRVVVPVSSAPEIAKSGTEATRTDITRNLSLSRIFT